MATEIIVPRLGWSMDEGEFAGWLKRSGDAIAAGDPLFRLEGEKATQDIEAEEAGLLWIPSDAPREGERVQVGQILAYLLAEGESPPAHPARQVLTPRSQAAPRVSPESGSTAIPRSEPTAVVDAAGPRNRATPRARRAARRLGARLDQVVGSGQGGRVRERDVIAATERVEKRDLRPVIAARMVAGYHQAAPVTLAREARADELQLARARFREHPTDGVTPTFNELVMFLVCRALGDHPRLNALWTDQGPLASPARHLAFGVDTERGLLAPVVRDAEQMTLAELARRARTLIAAARSGDLNESQLTGGTFTVTNLGGLDIDWFTPILNLPQVAILGVGRAREAPVVHEGRITPGWKMGLSLTFDHRALDGADAARFLQTLAEIIERPAQWLLK